MLIDTHAHLEMEPFDNDREEAIKRARDAGVGYIITVGSDLKGCKGAVELAEKHDFIYASLGIHPHEVKDITDETHTTIRSLLKNKKVVAYGEIGLDYHYEHSPKDMQIRRFREQIQIAKEHYLPLIIHSRDAGDESVTIIKDEKAEHLGGIFHCFGGDLALAKKVVDMGFYISFSGTLTFPKALEVQNVAMEIPIENILIETDCPYLAPQPVRGKRNEPAYVKYVAERLAELKGLTFDDIGRITSFNAMSLFKIGKIAEEGKITYPIRDSLYLNLTNRCTSSCVFCVRYYTDFVKGHNLRLKKEPGAKELIDAIGDPKRYKEIVFCGYGEPLIRLDVVKEVAKAVKETGGMVRIDTNGHANLVHKRNILPELKGLVDSMSISLDADDADKYYKICQPAFGRETYKAVIEFIKEAKKYIPNVTVTVVRMPEIDIPKCEEIASELGVKLRVREYNVVG